jgi:hypothetical protein
VLTWLLKVSIGADYSGAKTEHKSEVLEYAHKLSLRFDSCWFNTNIVEHLRKKKWAKIKKMLLLYCSHERYN